MAPYGPMEHPCDLAPTERMYLLLHLVASEQIHSMYRAFFTIEKNYSFTKGNTELLLPLCPVGLQGAGCGSKLSKFVLLKKKSKNKSSSASWGS